LVGRFPVAFARGFQLLPCLRQLLCKAGGLGLEPLFGLAAGGLGLAVPRGELVALLGQGPEPSEQLLALLPQRRRLLVELTARGLPLFLGLLPPGRPRLLVGERTL